MRRTSLAIAAALLLAHPARAGDPAPEQLRITVVDGEVLFRGTNLDLDDLRAALTATGRQSETLYFQIGPNAKSTYISRVLRVVQAAGFSKFAIVGPTSHEPVMTIDPDQRFD